jgi:hypothetical protein
MGLPTMFHSQHGPAHTFLNLCGLTHHVLVSNVVWPTYFLNLHGPAHHVLFQSGLAHAFFSIYVGLPTTF